jgi:hypothetical protein
MRSCAHGRSRPNDQQARTTAPAPSLLAAAEALVHAYRARYAKRSTDGFRHDAPLYDEMVALNAAAIAFRTTRPGPAHFDMSKVEGDGT